LRVFADLFHASDGVIVIPSRMRRTTYLLCAICLILGTLLLRGDPRESPKQPAWEVKAVFPREVSPARYAQVSPREIQQLAAGGWQLVSVTPYVVLNEERGPAGRKLTVTQTYPAYFFQRPKPARPR